MFRPTLLPWARPRRELLLLALVAVAALTAVHVVSAQDQTRFCLSRSLVHGDLTVTPCIAIAMDRAVYNGRTYSDKAPGFAILAVPAVVATGLPPSTRWPYEGDLHLWGARVLTSGIAFLLLALMVGRVSEGLAPGWGGVSLVTFALGTLVMPLAAAGFEHVVAAAFGFGAFVLAWRGSPALAGVCAGMAVLCEYEAAAIGVVLAAFVALRGLRPLIRYGLGALPPLLGLAAYNRAAFGSFFHLSYRYVANKFAQQQREGLFGIHAPNAHSVHEVFVGDRGLLVCSPVIVAAAIGLVLVARRHLAATLAAAAIAAFFVIVNCGYFVPYGGVSPGPRFLVPALPFLALGLGPAYARWKWPTAALAVVSILASTALTLTWSSAFENVYRQTIWGELGRVLTQGRGALLVTMLDKNVFVWLGASRIESAAVVGACAAAAFAVSLRERRR